jgi:Tfp pilus assembly protein PilX
MMVSRRLVHRLREARATAGEQGIALITVLLMMAALAALTSTVAVVAIDNTSNAHADRQGTAALGISEAGVAQALSYIRKNGVMALACSPSCGATNPWGDSTNPKTVTVPGFNSVYKVWIEKVTALNMAATHFGGTISAPVGTYRVHAQGTNGSNPGTRNVTVEVDVTPFQFPIGVFAHTVTGGGSGSTHSTSIFSDGCISRRDKLGLINGEIDQYLGIPTAAYSTQKIYAGNTCSGNNSIHKTSPCEPAYPYDQDSQGAYNPAAYTTGPAQTAAWWSAWQTSTCKTATPTPADGSFVDATLMQEKFQFPATQLDAAYYDALKSEAIEQGFYFTNTNAIPAVLQPANAWQTYPHPVLYYDFTGSSQSVNLSDLAGYNHTAGAANGAAGCTAASAVVVIRNGDASLNSNTVVAANVFIPEGALSKLNGSAKLIGTVYANSVDITGTGDVWLDDCFLQNLPGSLLSISTRDFVETDR